MKSIEQLEKEMAEQRAKLERQIALAKVLPTNGRTFTWMGDGGYVGNDKQPDKEKSCPLDPWIFHGSFRGAQHVAYRAPDEYPDYGELASKMRRDYIHAVCTAYAPYLIETYHLKGRYASSCHAKFDWPRHKDYKDAEIVGTGYAQIEANASVEHSGSLKLEFFADIPGAGVVQVSMDLPNAYKLAPRAVGVSRYGQDGPVRSVDRWDIPPNSAVHVWRYGSGDHAKKNLTAKYLYATVDEALREAMPEKD